MADKVAIKTKTLEDIGEALRLHFGELKREGTVGSHTGTIQVLRTPNALRLAEYYDKYESPLTSDAFNPEYLMPHTGNPVVKTIRVNGAASLKIRMSYKVPQPSGREAWNYIWLGEGLCGQPDELHGEYLPSYPSSRDKDEVNQLYGIGQWYCPACGAQPAPGDIYFDHDLRCPYDWTPSKFPDFEKTWEDEDVYGTMGGPTNMGYRGLDMPLIERTFNGDSFTLIYCNDLGPVFDDIGCVDCGYYIELQAFREDGSLMEKYGYVVDELHNDYYPGEMAPAIKLLNNYPNAEEVKF